MKDKDRDLNPDFKGVWLYKEYVQCKELTLSETFVLSIIYSLDNVKGCYATNEYFEKASNIKEDRVTRIISSLVKKKFITCEYDYRNANPRTININPNKLKVNSHSQKQQGLIGESTNSHRRKQQGLIGENTIYSNNKDYSKEDKKEKREDDALFFLEEKYKNRYDAFEDYYKSKIDNYEKFRLDFNDKVLLEEVGFNVDTLFERLTKFARNWIKLQQKEKIKNGYNSNAEPERTYRIKIS